MEAVFHILGDRLTVCDDLCNSDSDIDARQNTLYETRSIEHGHFQLSGPNTDDTGEFSLWEYRRCLTKHNTSRVVMADSAVSVVTANAEAIVNLDRLEERRRSGCSASCFPDLTIDEASVARFVRAEERGSGST